MLEKNLDSSLIKFLYLNIYFHIFDYNYIFGEKDVWIVIDQNDTDMKNKLLKRWYVNITQISLKQSTFNFNNHVLPIKANL